MEESPVELDLTMIQLMTSMMSRSGKHHGVVHVELECLPTMKQSQLLVFTVKYIHLLVVQVERRHHFPRVTVEDLRVRGKTLGASGSVAVS